MVRATDNVCIDAYEWPNTPGVPPLLAVSGEPEVYGSPIDASMLCLSVGKRVCTRTEWMAACRGPEGFLYPYGDKYDAMACNTGARWKEVNAEKVAKRDERELVKLNQSSPSGSFGKCVSSAGAYDMVGNAEEWVRCDSGLYGWCLVGGYWASKGASCAYAITTHSPLWHYYETGFRCCRDVVPDDAC
jgi:formylglycine-generating enzyme required for sulfatase activity